MRAVIISLIAALLAPCVAVAQSKPSDTDKQVERQVRWYKYLDLSLSQQEQLVAILRKTHETRNGLTREQSKLYEQQHVSVEEILTPAQRDRYQKRNRRGQYKPYSYTRGLSSLRYLGLDVVALKKQLTLTGEQHEKVVAALQKVGDKLIELQTAARKLPRTEYYAKWKEAYAIARAEGRKAVEPLLERGQVGKFAEMNKAYDDRERKREEQRKAWAKKREERKKNPGANRTKPPADPIGDRTNKALADLALPAEEAAVLRPLIEGIIKYQETTRTQLAGLRASLVRLAKSSKDADKLTIKIGHLRETKKTIALKLKRLESELRELLTIEQEAKMVGHDVLR